MLDFYTITVNAAKSKPACQLPGGYWELTTLQVFPRDNREIGSTKKNIHGGQIQYILRGQFHAGVL